jgi:hypothetical protein
VGVVGVVGVVGEVGVVGVVGEGIKIRSQVTHFQWKATLLLDGKGSGSSALSILRICRGKPSPQNGIMRL